MTARDLIYQLLNYDIDLEVVVLDENGEPINIDVVYLEENKLRIY